MWLRSLYASYSDADYPGDKVDRKSIRWNVIMINAMAVTWCSKNQDGVALSTMEYELVAALEADRELLGVNKTLTEIGTPPVLPMTMFLDK